MADEKLDRSPSRLREREDASENRAYRPPSYMPSPMPRQGKTHRWVREGILSQPDHVNVHLSSLDGWVVAQPSDYPELKMFVKDGCIRHGGLLLHVADEAVIQKRKDYYTKLNRDSMQAIQENLMSQSDARMPILKPEHSTRTTRGRRG